MREDFFRNCTKRIPAYVPGKPIEEVQRELGINDVIKLASNENPLGASLEVRQAVNRAMEKSALYPDSNNFYLLEALAAEWDIAKEWLLVGNGLDDVNRILGETVLNPGDEVVIPLPTFSQYEIVTQLMDARPVKIDPNAGLTHDLKKIRAAMGPKTKLVYLCNPNNPTGLYHNRVDLVEFLKSLPKDVLVVLDEAYADFVAAPNFPGGFDLLKKGFKNIIVFRTFSKIHGIAGLRLGYAAAVPEVIAQMGRVKDPFNVNSLAQAAGKAALTAKEHVRLTRELVFAGKNLFYRELAEMGLEYLPTEANFILINCGRDSKPIYQYLLQQGVIVRATHSFGLPNHIRVTFGTAEQNQRFFRAFKEALRV